MRVLAQQARSHWTATHTLVSRSPKAILASFIKEKKPENVFTLFTISKNTPHPIVNGILKTVGENSLGCLSEVLPNHQDAFAVSFATFAPSPDSSIVPFHFQQLGRPNITLGREITSSKTDDSFDDGFEEFLSGKTKGFSFEPVVPEIEDLKQVPKDSVTEMIAFTADRTEPFLASISAFKRAHVAGIMGTSTPFHSAKHAPYTLFCNGKSVESGAVGIAITGSKPNISTHYSDMLPLGPLMAITSSKGNLILSLNNDNAARTLLSTLNSIPVAEQKAHEIYAAIFATSGKSNTDLSKALYVSKVMAGDPSRGAISIDTQEPIHTGYQLNFYYRDGTRVPSKTENIPTANAFKFTCIQPSEVTLSTTEEAPDDLVEVFDDFLAASENGVLVSSKPGKAWISDIAGATVTVEHT